MVRSIRESRWKPRYLVYGLAALVVASILLAGWFNQTDDLSIEIADTGRVFLISDAGPIEITNGDSNRLALSESWLLNRPTLETLADSDEVVLRVGCRGLMPCRSSAVLTVAEGTEVVLVSSAGTILVDSFDGDLTIYDDFGDTVLGDVRGSIKVVSANGRVYGAGLEVDRIDVSTVSSEVALDFVRLPRQVLVVTGEESTRLGLPDGLVALDIVSPEDLATIEPGSSERADSTITIRSEGPVTVISTEPGDGN